MDSYRIKHKRTGLYYCKGRKLVALKGKTESEKSNLSPKGKIYHMYPTLDWTSSYRDETGQYHYGLNVDHWEIEGIPDYRAFIKAEREAKATARYRKNLGLKDE